MFAKASTEQVHIDEFTSIPDDLFDELLRSADRARNRGQHVVVSGPWRSERLQLVVDQPQTRPSEPASPAMQLRDVAGCAWRGAWRPLSLTRAADCCAAKPYGLTSSLASTCSGSRDSLSSLVSEQVDQCAGHCDKCGVEIEAGRLGRMWYHKLGMVDLCSGHYQELPSEEQVGFVLVDAAEKLGKERHRYTGQGFAVVLSAPASARSSFHLMRRMGNLSLLATVLALVFALMSRTSGNKSAILPRLFARLLLGRRAAVAHASKFA